MLKNIKQVLTRYILPTIKLSVKLIGHVLTALKLFNLLIKLSELL